MHRRAIRRPIEILLVEDNPADVRLTRETFKDSRVENNLNDVPDGDEAIAFMRQEGKYRDAPRPDLVLLDLNLPKRSGHEVLKEIRSDSTLRGIPVVILTISEDRRDILESYDMNANCYITKPVDLKRFITVVNSIEDFWLSTVELPSRGNR